MPGFQLGRIYKGKLENRVNKISDGRYFFVVVGVQLLTTICCRGLAFSAVWVTGFANAAFIPYLTVVTGIAFWLRISDCDQQNSVCLFMVHGNRKTYLCHYDASCVLVLCGEFHLLSAFPYHCVVCGI